MTSTPPKDLCARENNARTRFYKLAVKKACPEPLGNGAPEEIRTPDPQIRSLVLYPAELRAPCASRGKSRATNTACGAGHSYSLRRRLARQTGPLTVRAGAAMRGKLHGAVRN